MLIDNCVVLEENCSGEQLWEKGKVDLELWSWQRSRS